MEILPNPPATHSRYSVPSFKGQAVPSNSIVETFTLSLNGFLSCPKHSRSDCLQENIKKGC